MKQIQKLLLWILKLTGYKPEIVFPEIKCEYTEIGIPTQVPTRIDFLIEAKGGKIPTSSNISEKILYDLPIKYVVNRANIETINDSLVHVKIPQNIEVAKTIVHVEKLLVEIIKKNSYIKHG